MTRAKVPVGEKALLMRINRKLKQDGEQVRKARSEKASYEVGDFFRVDYSDSRHGGHLVEKNVDLEKLGTELGVLHPWESLREED